MGPLPTPLTLQRVHGLDATATGWVIAPMMIGLGIGASASAWLGRYPWTRWAGWLPISVGLGLALVNHIVIVVVGLALVGLGAGFVLPLALIDIQGAAATERLGQAGGLVQFGRTAGAAAGIPALSLWLLCGLHIGVTAIFITLIVAATAGLLLNLVDRRSS